VHIMNKPVEIRISFLAVTLFAVGALGAQELNTSPFQLDDPDRPSNGVLRLTAEAVSTSHPKDVGDPPLLPNGRKLWEGVLMLKVTNISQRMVTLDVDSAQISFYYEVWDVATRKRVLGTPYGERVAGWQRGPLMFTHPDTLHLAPGEFYEGMLDLAKLFQLKVGGVYTVKIRRTIGARTRDEAGKPLSADNRDLTCTVQVTGDGVEK